MDTWISNLIFTTGRAATLIIFIKDEIIIWTVTRSDPVTFELEADVRLKDRKNTSLCRDYERQV